MNITIANKDRTNDMGAAISEAVRTRKQTLAALTAERDGALQLKSASSEQEFQNKYLQLLSARNFVTTDAFRIPRKPGFANLVLSLVKRVLWKLLRYQHDRMIFQQNTINIHLLNALSLERSIRMKQISDIETKLAEIESRLPQQE